MEQSRVSRTDAPTERAAADRGRRRRVARPRRASGARGHAARPRSCSSATGCTSGSAPGAFGVVWRARDERLERDVAVKAIALVRRSAALGPRRRARRERPRGWRIPAIVTLYEAGAEDGTTYLVSELVRGGDARAAAARGRAVGPRRRGDRHRAVRRARARARAGRRAPRREAVQRARPRRARRPATPAAKLTDFGVARVVGAGSDALTRTGDVVGTLAYMAPEQAEGRRPAAPADLYATALVLYEALSGVNPVRGGSAVATARKLGATLPPLRRQRRDLPPDAVRRDRPRAAARIRSDRGTVADLSRALSGALRDLGDEPGTVEAPAVERAATAVTQVADATRRGWRRRSREQELADVARGAGRARRLDRRGPAWPGRAAGAPIGRGRRGGGARAATGPARHGAGAARCAGHVLPGLAAGGLARAGARRRSAAARRRSGRCSPARSPPRSSGCCRGSAGSRRPPCCSAGSPATPAGRRSRRSRSSLACALAAPPLLLPLRGRAWSVPFAAPLLGVALLAGAYPAVAGQARTLWRRAALGALGFWMLALAEPVAHETLYYGRVPAGTARPAAALGGLAARTPSTHVLAPLLDSGVLACAGAVGGWRAAILPWLVRGRSAALDLVAATLWAAGLAAGAGAIGARARTGRGAAAGPARRRARRPPPPC